MIGGIDVHIPTRAGELTLDVAVRVIRQQWSQAVFEDALTGKRFGSFAEIPFRIVEELFVYRDNQAADAWDAEGAVPSVQNSMIHLIPNDDTLTIVMDEAGEVMDGFVKAIESGLHDEILFVPAQKSRAA